MEKAAKKVGVMQDMQFVIGVDATKSNLRNGQNAYGGKSLHAAQTKKFENPYSMIMRLLLGEIQTQSPGELGRNSYLKRCGACLTHLCRIRR